jgi:hypothetical protein
LPRIALKKLNLNRPTFQGRQIIAGIQRGDDRKRKMNMKPSNITSGLVLGVTLLLATGASAASKGSLKLNEAVSVNGTQLAKGEYEIMWEGTGPNLGFVSANFWDGADAKTFGLRTHWINRTGVPADELSIAPDVTLKSLTDLADALAWGYGTLRRREQATKRQFHYSVAVRYFSPWFAGKGNVPSLLGIHNGRSFALQPCELQSEKRIVREFDR